MFEGILAAAEGLKTIAGSIKPIRELVSDIEGKEKINAILEDISGVYHEVINASVQNMELVNKVRELEQKLSEQENWEKVMERYQLCEWASQVFAYRLKDEYHDEEPLHYLCPNCVHERQKSIMSKRNPSDSVYQCPNCKWESSFAVYVRKNSFANMP